MNEGCATYCHYRIMTSLHATGRISDGSFLEFLESHTNAIRQPTAHEPSYGGINPYALGFDMMRDIERIAREPTEEDRRWVPQIAGAGDEMAALREIWANYRDDIFIGQFLSPHLMRKWRLFHIVDEEKAPKLKVASIHNERGYQDLRRSLAQDYEVGRHTPDIQVVDVDLAGNRRLTLHHRVFAGRLLEAADAMMVLRHLTALWGYDVVLEEVDATTNEVLKAHMASPES